MNNQHIVDLTNIKGIIKIMKLTLIFMIVGFSQIAAATYAQSVPLSIIAENEPLEDILRRIEDQSEFLFFYNVNEINIKERLTITKENSKIKEILDEISQKTGINYVLKDRHIIFTKNDVPTETSIQQAKRWINGTVTDTNGEPLVGVTIALQGTTTGTTTDVNGKFSLEAPGNAILRVSYIGYNTIELPVEDKQVLSIVLSEDVRTLNEVVVVGYGTQKRANLTGAVAQVSGEVMKDRQVTNIGQALQGTVGNLYITTTGDPGGVGTPAAFNIRGTTSINGGGPLFVVDGVPTTSIDNLNPADIESVTVLKDAASSAIYGARAAYGVILVTTRKGSVQKTVVSYSSMVATSSPTRLPKQANSLDFAQTYNAAAKNSGLSNPFTDEHIERIKKYMANPNSIPVTTADIGDPTVYGFENANANTDWFKEYLKPSYFSQKHDLSVSGGQKSITYFMSLGYYDQDGILRHGDEKFNRINTTANLRAEPLSWLRFDVRMRYSRSNTDIPYPYSSNTGNWFHLIGTRQPIWPAINPDGNYSMISFLTPFFNGARDKTLANDLWLTGAMEIEPLKNWLVNVDFTHNSFNNKRISHEGKIYAHKIDGTKYPFYANTSISESAAQNSYNSLNVYTSYFKQLNNHYFKVLIGQQVELAQFYTLSGSRRDMMTDNIPSMGVATGQQFSSDSMSEWATVGTFGRLNYNYDEKYLIELNARYDGTSRFPRGKRFGLFPSVSVGYNIARENFWPVDKKIMNDFKIRASYGSLGNQSVSNYIYFATVPINTQLGYILNNTRPNYLGAPDLVSSDITWEISNTIDIGLDAALLNNRLSLSFDWYSRTTLDMLGPANALPVTLGASVPLTNNADLRTRGFELNISWRQLVNKDLNYNVSFVVSDFLSKVIKYNNPTGLLSTYYEGQTIGEYWGYESPGIIQTQAQLDNLADQSLFWGTWNIGDVEYKDQNGDGKINYGKNTIEDHGDYKIVGNNTPRFQFGLNASVNWKNFDVNMFLQGVAKRDLWVNGTMFYGLLGGYGSQVWESTLDYWTPENTGAYFPRPYHTGEIEKNRQVSDHYLQNAAYIRLKNLQIGYTIPQMITNRWKIDRIRFFVTGENLITISGINENFDPEVAIGSYGSGKIYPLMRTFSFGLNLDF